MFQLSTLQEKIRKLVEESSRKKKEKKKNKLKKKSTTATISAVAVPNSSSSTGKPGAHGSLNKTSSLVDSVEDSIASVVSGGDIKMNVGESGATHHAAATKAVNVHHHVAATGANASTQAKTTKAKGKRTKLFPKYTNVYSHILNH